jgi:hypothetical protein
VAEHLIKLGCQHLAWIARPHSAATVEARIAGTRESCIRHNLDLPRDWINTGDPEDLKFLRRLVSARRWDAAICANDWTAAQLLRSLGKCRMRVPQDIRVVGFDDAKYATVVSVPLTTIRQSCRDIAITAFSAMMERIAEPTRPPRLLLLTPRIDRTRVLWGLPTLVTSILAHNDITEAQHPPHRKLDARERHLSLFPQIAALPSSRRSPKLIRTRRANTLTYSTQCASVSLTRIRAVIACPSIPSAVATAAIIGAI